APEHHPNNALSVLYYDGSTLTAPVCLFFSGGGNVNKNMKSFLPNSFLLGKFLILAATVLCLIVNHVDSFSTSSAPRGVAHSRSLTRVSPVLFAEKSGSSQNFFDQIASAFGMGGQSGKSKAEPAARGSSNLPPIETQV
ncbi:unnamed protein product, partial [Heterosigma akashiwo]